MTGWMMLHAYSIALNPPSQSSAMNDWMDDAYSIALNPPSQSSRPGGHPILLILSPSLLFS